MRLFAGCELPADVAEALAAWPVPEGLRPVPAEKLHVTLFFLGERDDPDLCRAALRALPRERLRLRTGGVAVLGRVVAIELDDPTGALRALHAVGFPGWARERRPFRPHVTVARGVGRDVPALPAPPPRRHFAVPALVLWRSRGGRYEPLERVRLG